MNKESSLWITWEHQVRNISMANLLDCNYVELESKSSRLIRYLTLTILTIKILRAGNYNIIFFQNPSIMLGVICAFYKKIRPNCLVIGDFHNAALEPGKLQRINRFISKTIDVTLVSNSNLFDAVKKMGGRPFAFPDPIPNPCGSINYSVSDVNYILFISSWAEDEPINHVLDAFIASGLWEGSYELRVTGRIKEGRLEKPKEYYEKFRIKFLGYLTEEVYWQSLAQAALNIDLTTRDDCLVCGAYEAISVAAPVLLSNNNASLAYFGDYAIFTDNSTPDIRSKLLFAIDNLGEIRSRCEQIKNKFIEGDADNKHKLCQTLTL